MRASASSRQAKVRTKKLVATTPPHANFNALDTFDSHFIKFGAGSFIWCELGGGTVDYFMVLVRRELMFVSSDVDILGKEILDVTVHFEVALA